MPQEQARECPGDERAPHEGILSQGITAGNLDAGDEGTGATSTHEMGRAGTGLKGSFTAEIFHDIDGTSEWHTFLVRPSHLYRENRRNKQQNQNNEKTSVWIQRR